MVTHTHTYVSWVNSVVGSAACMTRTKTTAVRVNPSGVPLDAPPPGGVPVSICWYLIVVTGRVLLFAVIRAAHATKRGVVFSCVSSLLAARGVLARTSERL